LIGAHTPKSPLVFCVLALLLSACAAPEATVGPAGPGLGQGGSGIAGSSGWATGGSSLGGAAGAGGLAGGGGAAAAGGAGGGVACSADLHSVVDSTGAVVETCDATEGCSEGTCVPSCAAADARSGNMGCAFSVPTSPFMGAGWPGAEGISMRGPCHALLVANAWTQPAKLSLAYGAQVLDVAKYARIPTGSIPYPKYEPLPAVGLPPGEVAVVFLSHDPKANNGGIALTCPVAPALTFDTALSTSGRGTAFRLTSDTPLTTYDIIPYGGAKTFGPSASLLMPEKAWGKQYVVVAPHDQSSDPILGGRPWLTLVGSVDGTSVQITPQAALPPGPDVSGAPAGKTTTTLLNAGETLQWLGADPTGAIVSASAPVAAFSGNSYLWVTGGESVDGGRDAAHQQLPSLSALGSEYVGAGVVTRRANLAPETSVYRLMGVVDGTALEWEPAAPQGAPTTLSAGQVVEVQTTQVFVVRSQDSAHPFSFSQYMTGGIFDTVMRMDGTLPLPIGIGSKYGLGDEEWVIGLPTEQFLSRYVFFTDPTFATTNVVVTRAKDAAGFHDVYIGCLGSVTGWQSVGADYQVARVDLVRKMKAVGQCTGSRHEAWSEAPFGVTVWGTDWCASYAYPAGGSARAVNTLSMVP